MSVNSFAYYGSFATFNLFLALILTAATVPVVSVASSANSTPGMFVLTATLAAVIYIIVGVLAYFLNAALLRSDLRPVK